MLPKRVGLEGFEKDSLDLRGPEILLRYRDPVMQGFHDCLETVINKFGLRNCPTHTRTHAHTHPRAPTKQGASFQLLGPGKLQASPKHIY
jgi:hypothetical protein